MSLNISQHRHGLNVRFLYPKSPYNRGTHSAPWIKDFSYDPATDTIRNVQSGRGYSRADFLKLAREEGARNAYSGATSLERAVIAGSVLQAADEPTRWREFLAGVAARRSTNANRLAYLFYSKSQTPPNGGVSHSGVRFSKTQYGEVTEAQERAFIRSWIDP